MAPAFSSARQTWSFALAIILSLAMPAALPNLVHLDRRDIYPSLSVKDGPFSWFQRNIFLKTQAADVVFLGSSHMWADVDTPYVQRKFSAALGRDADVFSLCFPTPGFDADYVFAHDLLEHRPVKMLVVYDEGNGGNLPHPAAFHWFRVGENADVVEGLSAMARIRLYADAVLGAPRHFLSLVRRNFAEDPLQSRPSVWNTFYNAPNFAETLGSVRVRLGYGMTRNFSEFEPQGHATPAEVRIYSKDTRDSFEFTGPPLPPYQLHFAQQLAHLCAAHQTRLVFLHLPLLTDQGQTRIHEREFWPDALGAPLDMVGIPAAELFSGIRVGELPRLFYNDDHMNQNGQRYFTPLITPALLKLYGESSKHHQ